MTLFFVTPFDSRTFPTSSSWMMTLNNLPPAVTSRAVALSWSPGLMPMTRPTRPLTLDLSKPKGGLYSKSSPPMLFRARSRC